MLQGYRQQSPKHAFSFEHVNIPSESNHISHVFRLRAWLAYAWNHNSDLTGDLYS